MRDDVGLPTDALLPALASFNVEDFSLDRMKRLDAGEIEARFGRFIELVKFDKSMGR